MKLLEKIIIIGLIAILGVGIYFNTKNFSKKIDEHTHTENCLHSNQIEEVKPEEEKVEELVIEEKIEETSTKKEEAPKVEQPKKETTTTTTVTTTEKNGHKVQSLGVYKLTAYCSCAKCCGKSDGITASGTKVKAGRTIAAPSTFPFGTKIMINGHIYTVEDRGGAIKGNRIDIYFDTHEQALQFGVKNMEIFKVIE